MPDVTDFGVTGDGKVQGRAAGNLTPSVSRLFEDEEEDELCLGWRFWF